LDIDQEIKIEYFDMPEFDFELESKAFLGVMLTELPEKNGVLIQDVIEGSQAEKQDCKAEIYSSPSMDRNTTP
ncbi:MAG: hypothetical protein QNK63_02555, partial [Flavobacteriales bacterium]